MNDELGLDFSFRQLNVGDEVNFALSAQFGCLQLDLVALMG